MAKAKKKASRPKRAVHKKSAVKKAAATGPVTLKEAKALAIAKAPASAAKLTAISAAPKATPKSVAKERAILQKQQQDEIKERIKQYTETMKIMKARGVKGLSTTAGAATKKAAGAVTASTAGTPLQIFAEGDSWFHYPVPSLPPFGGGIIPRLEDKLGVPILSLAKAGDEVRFMLGVDERKLLIKQLTDGCPAGGPWDALLFSGGGNDIVGNPLALWLKNFKPGLPPAAFIDTARFDAALTLVRAGYEDLIALRDDLSGNTHLVFHGYDFAIPDGRGVCFMGPWLKPAFDLRKFASQATASAVVKEMLQQFAAMLASLASNHPKVTFINTQGTLAPFPASWHNELHPSKNGFDAITTKFHTTLKALFPSRVL